MITLSAHEICWSNEETLGMYKNFNKRLDLYAKLKNSLAAI